MEDFEGELRELLAGKVLDSKAGWKLNPKASLETLLEHVYTSVLVPAYHILLQQEDFAASTIAFEMESGFGDSCGDGMKDRAMATLAIVRQQAPLFEYWLSFDGDTNSREAMLWRRVNIIRQSSLDLNNLPADFFDENTTFDPGTTPLDEEAISSVEEYQHFHTLDMEEAVRLVQQDLYAVCNALL